LLTLENLTDRTLAEKMRGLEVLAEKSEVKSDVAESQSLIGFEVLDRGKLIGKVTNLEHTARHEVLVVRTPNNKEIMIPYVDKFIKEIINNSVSVDLTDLEEDNEI